MVISHCSSSLAIIAYVDRTSSGAPLIPDDAKAASLILQWSCAVNTSVFPAVIGYMQANTFPRGPGGRPDPQTVDGFLPSVRGMIAELDRAVASSGHLVGNTFTIADMYLLPILAYLRAFPESGEIIAGARNLMRYFDMHGKRASFRATIPPPLAPRP